MSGVHFPARGQICEYSAIAPLGCCTLELYNLLATYTPKLLTG
jgi:hypothetical protein